MRDLALLALLAAAVFLAFHRPWVGALALTFLGCTRPFAYAQGFAAGLPASAILLGALAVGTVVGVARGRLRLPWWQLRDWRLGLIAALWLHTALTSHFALLPDQAWAQFDEVSRTLVGLLPLLLLIDTAAKLRALLAVVALSVGVLAVKGGYWALLTGFGDRVYGPPGSHFYNNNDFAVVMLTALPLLALLRSQTASAGLRRALEVTLALSVCAVLSSWSRGGLIALSLTAGVMLLQARSLRALGLAGLAAALALLALPEAWVARMQSIAGYQRDASALNRLEAWSVGLREALAQPFLGVGFEGWQAVRGAGGRDWHSAYVEVAAEQGLFGLALWLALLVGTMLALRALGRTLREPDPDGAACAHALLAALVAYAAGGLFLGIAYWDVFFRLVVMAVLLEPLARPAPRAAAAIGQPLPGAQALSAR